MPTIVFILLAILLTSNRLAIAAPTPIRTPQSATIQKDDPSGDDDGGEDDEEDESADNNDGKAISAEHPSSQTVDADEEIEGDDNDDDDDSPIISGNITLTTDYVLRGLSQTDQKPAVQGGFEFNHDLISSFGVYANVFGSNVHFEDSTASMEFDTAAGLSYTFPKGIKLSAGALFYTYFGDGSRNSWEIPVKIEWKSITAEIDYNPVWAGDGHAWYFNLGWSDEIIYKFRLGFSVGYSSFSKAQNRLRTEDEEEKANEEGDADSDDEEELRTAAVETPSEANSAVESPNYFDFKVSLAREFLDLDWEIAGIWINHSEEINGTPGSPRAIFSVSKSF